jgi:hypothetical protein
VESSIKKAERRCTLSKTIAVGVVGPSHWAYMAVVMSEVLNRAVQKSALLKTDVPAGVLADAVRFSNLVLEEVRPSVSSNPLATINAYVMAKEVVEKVIGHYPSDEEFEPLLDGCRLLVDLKEKKEESKNVKLLEFMAKFFSELHKMGEEDRYERAMAGDGNDDE